MRVLFACGGTGGHIYPAVTMARGILERWPDSRILFVGGTRGLESDIIPAEGFQMELIPASGLKRTLTPENLRTIARAGLGVLRSFRIVRRFAPDIVVGTGGYVCGPVVLSAALLGIPTMIHEQNTFPGFTNRLLARFVRKIATSFEESAKYFPNPSKVAVTGNPVRKDVITARRDEARSKLGVPEGARVVLVFGGSQGSQTLNRAVISAARELTKEKDILVILQTGKGQYDAVVAQLSGAGISPMTGERPEGPGILVRPYIYNMPEVLAAADLVVSRAGAGTLSEITVRGLPSILVPHPYVPDNVQEKNARVLERAGAAKVILDRDMTGEALARAVLSVIGNPQAMRDMARASKRLGVPDALERLLALVADLAGTRRRGRPRTLSRSGG